jgi:hypothetical protein
VRRSREPVELRVDWLAELDDPLNAFAVRKCK